jgi:hypothetical protein
MRGSEIGGAFGCPRSGAIRVWPAGAWEWRLFCACRPSLYQPQHSVSFDNSHNRAKATGLRPPSCVVLLPIALRAGRCLGLGQARETAPARAGPSHWGHISDGVFNKLSQTMTVAWLRQAKQPQLEPTSPAAWSSAYVTVFLLCAEPPTKNNPPHYRPVRRGSYSNSRDLFCTPQPNLGCSILLTSAAA